MALTIAGRHTARASLATLGLAAIVVTGCAAPGAVATPAPTAPPASATPGDSSSPSPSAVAKVPNCGTDPVTLNVYFETIFELMPQLSAEFTKQFPNVTWELSQDQFANLITANRRGCSPATTRRTSSGCRPWSSPGEGRPAPEPRPLRDGVRLGQVAARPARARTASTADGKRGIRLARTRGPELQPDRRLLQQGAGRADRHDRAAEDGRRVRGAARQGEGRRAAADHGVERRHERRRSRVPAPEPHGRLRRRPRRSTTGSSRSRARPSTRPSNLEAAAASRAVDQERLLPDGHQRHRVHRRERPLRQGRGRVHVQRRLAERRLRHGPAGQGRASSILPPPRAARRSRCRRR